MSRIGIFSGTFDPVHKGHVAFALKAAEAAGLDKVYFLPESVPRRKEGVTHYAHRMAMLRLAVKPHKRLEVLDLPDKQFTVSKTLPRLEKRFGVDELHLLIGSDVVPYLAGGEWPNADKLLKRVHLIVGMRSRGSEQEVTSALQGLLPERSWHIVGTDNTQASSRDIRSALTRGHAHADALRSIDSYIKQIWLYASASLIES